MGYLKQKYTKEYFTGQDKNGNKLTYGVEGYQDFLNGKIRSIDLSILNQINFKGKKVLELGCGRGETIKYGIDNGSIQYDAVDFSKDAIAIAENFLKSNNIKNAKLYCDDALFFLKKIIKKEKIQYDIIIMFDFIEHVPREELSKILKLINIITHDKSLIAINTPNFKVDNDVIKSGLNTDSIDNSDLILETKGMHCNKYTVISLQQFMKDNGFINISENHFFIYKNNQSNIYKSYFQQWKNSYKEGYPIQEKYKNDIVEFAYEQKEHPSWIKFTKGDLKNINLLLTKDYKEICYPNGEYDQPMFNDFVANKNNNKNTTIFDIGGFMGVSSILFSKITRANSKIYSFEPNPYNLNRMLLNFSENQKISNNISIINIALSDKTEDTEFLLSTNVDNGHSSTSRLLNTHVEHSQEYLKELGFFKQKIHQDTLDNLVKNTKIYPDIIKVDIEGAEHLFLLGAQKFLKTHSPILYIELHSQYCALKCTEIMDTLGYSNTILFEEPDNRILVRYYKDNSKRKLTNTKIIEIEQKIINDQLTSLKNKLSVMNQKNLDLENRIKAINIQFLESENKKTKLIKEFKSKEKYLIKITNNPIIKSEIKTFKIIKKIINLF